MTLTPQWLDELRARTTLSTLVGRTVKLTKAGREYKACCPFHSEKSPSFTVNDEKGFYHCFGCSAHGDAIRWMTDQRGLSFMDAVKELADAAGMSVPAPDPRAARQAEQATGLRDVLAASAEWFSDQLWGIEGAHVRRYLKGRDIAEPIVRAFGLGFAPDSRNRLKAALKDVAPELLVESGMAIQVDDGEPYDRFRGRLMIPIRDPRGRVIAFGGRILGSGEPKYLNSPDTPLFDKGRTLYNLDRASPASRATNRVIVVEGYMDVIALAQAGFDEAVAPLGTALTEHQIAMLWRMVPEPVLCFDGDEAGRKAAMRAAMRALPLIKPGHSLSFVTLPAGLDPDDLVRKNGPQAFENLLARPEPLVERIWKHQRGAEPLDTPEQRAGLKQRLAEIAGAIADRDVAAHYRQAFRERYDALFFSRPAPARGAHHSRPGATSRFWQADPRLRPPHGSTRAIGGSGLDTQLVDAILVGLLRYPAKLAEHAEELASLKLADSSSRALLHAMLDSAYADSGLDSAGLLAILANSEVYNKAQALLRADGLHFSFTLNPAESEAQAELPKLDLAGRAGRDLDEAIGAAVTWPQIDAALEEATKRARESLDEESFAAQQQLRAMKAELTRRLGDLMQFDEVG